MASDVAVRSDTYRQDKLLAIPDPHHIVVVSEVDPLQTKLFRCAPHILVGLYKYGRAQFDRLILRVVIRVDDRAS